MSQALHSLDWNYIQSFTAVAQHGSLSAAARKLGQSQPTVGRHIKALEGSLGIDLFTRASHGLVPTQAGLKILDYALQMEKAAAGLKLSAAGQATDLAGTVRITASVAVSHFLMPDIILELRRAHPEIQIELVPSDATENLIFREADIAIRMYRPTQLDVITRHVADQSIGLYAATKFLDQVGRPANADELMQMAFVGFDKNDLIIRTMASLGFNVSRDYFPVRCDDQAVYWNLVCAGCGVGAAQIIIGDAETRVERIASEFEFPKLSMWLAAPEALRTNSRIRAVWDMLADALAVRTGA